ncbi:MAG: hypothetical protein U0892_08050 [Pirellulales bacterium]
MLLRFQCRYRIRTRSRQFADRILHCLVLACTASALIGCGSHVVPNANAPTAKAEPEPIRVACFQITERMWPRLAKCQGAYSSMTRPLSVHAWPAWWPRHRSM